MPVYQPTISNYFFTVNKVFTLYLLYKISTTISKLYTTM